MGSQCFLPANFLRYLGTEMPNSSFNLPLKCDKFSNPNSKQIWFRPRHFYFLRRPWPGASLLGHFPLSFFTLSFIFSILEWSIRIILQLLQCQVIFKFGRRLILNVFSNAWPIWENAPGFACFSAQKIPLPAKAYPCSTIVAQCGHLTSFQFSEVSSTRTTLFFFNNLLTKIQMKRSSRRIIKMASAISFLVYSKTVIRFIPFNTFTLFYF